jgi:transposase
MVAKNFGLIERTLLNWVKAANKGKHHPAASKKVTPEQMELSRASGCALVSRL